MQKPTSSEKSSLDKSKNEEWQVFENAEDAKAFIKSNRNATKDSGNTKNESPKEYKNDNLPLRATGYNDKESSIRLNRFIANTGICSRREADDLIEAGVVKVNGKIVTSLEQKLDQVIPFIMVTNYCAAKNVVCVTQQTQRLHYNNR